MALRMIALGALAAAAAAGAAAAAQPARAEFFGVEEMRALCRGETDDARQFRTDAGHRLLAQVSRERCRMYLLGLAEGRLRRTGQDGGGRCLPAGTTEAEVADFLVGALVEGHEAGGSVDEIVGEALRARYGCG